MSEPTIELYGLSAGGVGLTDQLWAMARDGATLLDIGRTAFAEMERRAGEMGLEPEEFNESDAMEYAVVLLTASLGIGLTA